MKLKKLLPIASLAGVAAVVAPLVTSCTNAKTYSYIFDASRPAREWTPKDSTGKAQAQELSSWGQGLDLWMNDISKNKEIFADNILYSTIQYYVGIMPDRGLADIIINKIDKKENRVSFEVKTSITSSSIESNYDMNLDVKVESMAYTMIYSTEWVFMPTVCLFWQDIPANKMQTAMMLALSYLISDKKWSISLNYSSKLMENRDIYVKFDSNSSTKEFEYLFKAFSGDYAWLSFTNLYYMQDITYKAPLKQ